MTNIKEYMNYGLIIRDEYQDIYEVTYKDLKEKIPNIKKKLEKLVKDYETSRILYFAA